MKIEMSAFDFHDMQVRFAAPFRYRRKGGVARGAGASAVLSQGRGRKAGGGKPCPYQEDIDECGAGAPRRQARAERVPLVFGR